MYQHISIYKMCIIKHANTAAMLGGNCMTREDRLLGIEAGDGLVGDGEGIKEGEEPLRHTEKGPV